MNNRTTKDTKEKEPDYYGHRQRLRERFLISEGKEMADYEFLEFLLTYAIPRRDVKPLAKELIRRFGSFAEVVSASKEDLLAVDGIKENTMALIKAIREGSLRLQWEQLKNDDQPIINSFDAMIEYCRTNMGYKDVEEFNVVYLNSKLRVMDIETQQRGTVNHVAVHPREVVKKAVLRGASSIILVHNHPSGDTTPSSADLSLTKAIVEACDALNIGICDHLIISKYGHYSFMDHNLIPPPKKR